MGTFSTRPNGGCDLGGAASTSRTVPHDDLSAGPSSSGYSLLVVSGEQTSKFALPATGRIVVGRSRGADVRVDHPSVSREHVALHLAALPRVEDLRSANGTRLGGLPLDPGTPVPIRPNDVLELGAVLLVLRDRTLSSRGERTCHPALFELHLEEEETRLASGGGPFAVARLRLDGTLGPHAAELVVASALEGKDVSCSPVPGRHEILFFGAEAGDAEVRLARVLGRLSERGACAQSTLTCYPPDGPLAKEGRSTVPVRVVPSKETDAIAHDPASVRVFRLLERVAQGALSVLLLGETGVGKEVCAEYLHRRSARAGGPFVRLNCAALPESLIDAELFGHQRGAFTGAVADRAGLLETASGGTVLLDEIGDMPLTTQVRLLRVLEAKEVTRVGSNKVRHVDVRVVAATHHDLAELITAGRFREDFYYRLNGISIVVPPLRERPLDIEPLAHYFVARCAQGRRALSLSTAGLTLLRSYPWPGNVRELRNLIERAVALCDGLCIEPEHLTLDAAAPGPVARRAATPSVAAPVAGLREQVDTLERERILTALAACGGSQRAAARMLGLSRGSLIRRLDRLGILKAR